MRKLVATPAASCLFVKPAVRTIVNHFVKNITKIRNWHDMETSNRCSCLFFLSPVQTRRSFALVCAHYSVKPLKCTGLRELTCVILATLLHRPAHYSPTCKNILHLLTPCIAKPLASPHGELYFWRAGATGEAAAALVLQDRPMTLRPQFSPVSLRLEGQFSFVRNVPEDLLVP